MTQKLLTLFRALSIFSIFAFSLNVAASGGGGDGGASSNSVGGSGGGGGGVTAGPNSSGGQNSGSSPQFLSRKERVQKKNCEEKGFSYDLSTKTCLEKAENTENE